MVGRREYEAGENGIWRRRRIARLRASAGRSARRVLRKAVNCPWSIDVHGSTNCQQISAGSQGVANLDGRPDKILSGEASCLSSWIIVIFAQSGCTKGSQLRYFFA